MRSFEGRDLCYFDHVVVRNEQAVLAVEVHKLKAFVFNPIFNKMNLECPQIYDVNAVVILIKRVCRFIEEVVVLDGPESKLGPEDSLIDQLPLEGPDLKQEISTILLPQPLVLNFKNDRAEVHIVGVGAGCLELVELSHWDCDFYLFQKLTGAGMLTLEVFMAVRNVHFGTHILLCVLIFQ